ncbi:FAD dependent oxidoreductase [Mycena amicta]|nr:FAD dependent oxidoreductase [Mycena amicta]
MGTALSRIRLALKTVSGTIAEYQQAQNRIDESPGIPVPQPTTSFWAIPASSISQWGADEKLVPEYADVVVIGSGITGTAVARTLLEAPDPPRVVMLEARDACSGATARNGGHITPNLFHDYQELKSAYKIDIAKEIIRFRLAHLDELLQISGEIDDTQCRKVETFDLYLDEASFQEAKESLEVYLRDMPEQKPKWRIVENVQELQLSPEIVVGGIATSAGAMHPYRFVTGVLSRLLSRHPETFHLFTNTPCFSITSESSHYTVTTPKGTIHAKHIVHATNGWASHLLPAMRGKISPVRGHMTAQRPGTGLGRVSTLDTDSVSTLADSSNSWLGTRSFVFSGAGTYNYLTQQTLSSSSASAYPPPNGELMFGGGLSFSNILSEIGVADDHAPVDLSVAAYLGGALSPYFGAEWGAEGRPEPPQDKSSPFDQSRVMNVWTGILGFSADRQPWVGRLPPRITGRQVPKVETNGGLASPGEWIAAGYSGEGMVHAYLSGKAVAHMLLLDSQAQVPEPFLVTERRWKKAKMEKWVK